MRKSVIAVGWFLPLLFVMWTAGCGTDQAELATDVLAAPEAFGPSARDRSGSVPDQYIVVLRSGVAHEDVLSPYGITPLRRYEWALNGFAARLSAEQAALLAEDSKVTYVEPDQYVWAYDPGSNPIRPVDDLAPPPGKGKPDKGEGDDGGSESSQVVPTGISRIHADAGIDGQDIRADVDIAILDTGISLKHPDLYVVQQVTFAGGRDADDKNGHGSHVAGTAAALDNDFGVVGVAPGARLWAVKVLGNDGSGFLSNVIAGVDYVTQNAAAIEVANMSLGGPDSQALNDAISGSIAAGVVTVVAAGNNGTDASNTSPANHPGVLTVSAIADSDGKCGREGSPTRFGDDDHFATFSNYGANVRIAAPGVEILSTYKGSNYAIGSGTSMAAPHVTGVVARYLAVNGKPTDAAGVAAVIEAVINAGFAQSTECGFLGDPDAYPEPVVNAGAF